jgi:peptidoglycan/xylan/chitin deacetylase (PgdA/CDA1 family)
MDHVFEVSAPACREVMSVAEIADLARMPQITIGSHSVNHSILPNCDAEELRKEINNSKRELEEWTGRPVRVFSYPNGDFDERTLRVLAEAGYSLAFTTENRAITLGENPYYIPRCSIMDDGSLAENICHALGLSAPVVNALKRRKPALKEHGPVPVESEFPQSIPSSTSGSV